METDYIIQATFKKMNNTEGLRYLNSLDHRNIRPTPNIVHDVDGYIRELDQSIVSPPPPLMSFFDLLEENDDMVFIHEALGKEFIVISDTEEVDGDEDDQDIIFIGPATATKPRPCTWW